MKNKLLDLGFLWLRVIFALGIMQHGWGKIIREGGVPAWTDASVVPMGLPVPLLFGYLAVLSELVGGFLVLLGLWTRYASFAVACVVSTAAFVKLAAEPWSKKELAVAYAVVAVFFIIAGPGKYSVDGSKGGGRSSSAKKSK